MSSAWRLVDSGALPPPQSAAVDEAVLEARSRSLVPDTLHFYTRSQPTVSLGRFQKIAEAVDVAACRARGVAVVRRRSGGGTIYTDSGQILFALISSRSVLGEDATGSFARVCAAVADSLTSLGVDARYRPVNDVEVRGKKISGSAQLRRRGSVLHHGSVLVNTDLETMDAVLINTSIAPSDRVTTLSLILGRTPDVEDVKRLMAESFREALGIEFEIGGLTEYELGLVENYVASHYGKEEWNLGP